MQKIPHRLWIALIALAAVGALTVTAGLGQAAAPALKKVENRKVCMITDHAFDKDQIPVKVEGRTYYGCCEMCKERLAKDASSRTALDPVTGNKIDKAQAVIAAQADGSVVYFESDKTLERYLKGERKK